MKLLACLITVAGLLQLTALGCYVAAVIAASGNLSLANQVGYGVIIFNLILFVFAVRYIWVHVD